MDIDVGGSGGSEGPWISWQARESLDGSRAGRKFYIRGQDGTAEFAHMERGVVFDIEAMKTGWCFSTGQKGTAPEWLWNATLGKFAPMPPDRGVAGARWQRGFSIPIAFGPNPTDTAIWEQAQGGAWAAFSDFAGLLRGAQPGKLPVVRMNGVKKIDSAKGTTSAPILEVVKWVDRPANLQRAGVDTGDQWAA